MSAHMEREIEGVKMLILAMGAKVEANINRAAKSLVLMDEWLAKEAISMDAEIDAEEVRIEEECLKILALHQPVATDLRFIVAVLKINNDLERIDDLGVNIAKRTVLLGKYEALNLPIDFTHMADLAQQMLRKSLDALVNYDTALAREVLSSDDAVDEMNREIYELVKHELAKRPPQIGPLIHLLTASRNFERIADHATNIAEDIIYMIDGNIIRHGHAAAPVASVQ